MAARLAFAAGSGSGNGDDPPPIFANRQEALRASYETLEAIAHGEDFAGHSFEQKKEAFRLWLKTNDEDGWSKASLKSLKKFTEGLTPIIFGEALAEQMTDLGLIKSPDEFALMHSKKVSYYETRRPVGAKVYKIGEPTSP